MNVCKCRGSELKEDFIGEVLDQDLDLHSGREYCLAWIVLLYTIILDNGYKD